MIAATCSSSFVSSRQAVEAAAERLAHAVRDRDVGDRVLRERAFLRHQVHDLAQEEGVALRLLEDAVEHVARAARRWRAP